MTRLFQRMTHKDIGVRARNWIENNRVKLICCFIIGCLLFPLALQLLPAAASTPIIHVGAMTLLYMVLALGLNIVPGFTGLLDLGYVGFYGVGAYTAGILSVDAGLPFWQIVPLAALNGALFGILLGAPTLRLTGDYFAIVTFGFSELVVLFITNEAWLTRGTNGITAVEPIRLLGFTLSQPHQYYYIILAILLGGIIAIRHIERSRVGRAWFAIRENELAASASGINIVTYKVIAFAVSAAIAAIAGVFLAHTQRFISPGAIPFWQSIFILCLVVLGGMGSVTGVLVGAAVLYPLVHILRETFPGSFANLMLGLIMILMMRFRPSGLLPRGGGLLGPHPTKAPLDSSGSVPSEANR